jgi:hypothetical protein
MKTFRTAVIAVLLAIWSFPAVSLAAPPPSPPAATQQVAPAPVTQKQAAETEAAEMAQREQQTADLQDFKGGAVYLYFGSGVALVLLIILIVLLV